MIDSLIRTENSCFVFALVLFHFRNFQSVALVFKQVFTLEALLRDVPSKKKTAAFEFTVRIIGPVMTLLSFLKIKLT